MTCERGQNVAVLRGRLLLYGLALFATLGVAQGVVRDVEGAGTETGAQTPLDLVRSAVARVQEMARAEGNRSSESERAEIRRTAGTLFDFEAMSRRMLARHWNDGTPPQQAEFVGLLTNLLGRTYLDVITNEARATTTFDGESIQGLYAQVRTRVAVDRGGPGISLEYRLFRNDDRWAAYDIVHEGASLVANYRSQFNTILRTSSFSELLERMRSKELQGPMAAESIQEIGRRLTLFAVVTDRGLR